jgi:NADPH:quinone reductase-like Zn-dependent oxidoreductase
MPLAGLTALQALRDLGRLRAGMRVLIVGAAGGVGHFAVQIARAAGAQVTAVCSARHTDMVRALGAHEQIDYAVAGDFLAGRRYDLILDLIVRAPLGRFLRALSAGSVYVATLPSVARIAAAILLPAFARRRVRLVAVKSRAPDLEELLRRWEAGTLRPVIERRFRLDELAEAHALSRTGHVAGKIVIEVGAG